MKGTCVANFNYVPNCFSDMMGAFLAGVGLTGSDFFKGDCGWEVSEECRRFSLHACTGADCWFPLQ